MFKIALEFGIAWLLVVMICSVSSLMSCLRHSTSFRDSSHYLSVYFDFTIFADADMEYVIFTFIFRHRQSWQYAARININRADLLRYIFELSLDLGIQYETAPPRRIIIQGEPDQKFDPSSIDKTSFNQGSAAGPDSLVGTGPLD